MDDNTKMQNFLVEMQLNAVKASQLETLVNMLLNGAILADDKAEMFIGNGESIMEFIAAINPEKYTEAFNYLIMKREIEKNRNEDAHPQTVIDAEGLTYEEGANYMQKINRICNRYGLNKSSYFEKYKLNPESTNEDYFNACNELMKEIEG
jgi:hypothetical protein